MRSIQHRNLHMEAVKVSVPAYAIGVFATPQVVLIPVAGRQRLEC